MFPVLIIAVFVMSACGTPAPSPSVAPTDGVATPSVAPTKVTLPAPEALLSLDGGGSVRVSAVCWDEDLLDCEWQTGIGTIVPSASAEIRLRIVGATPDAVTVSWRPATELGAPAPGPSASGGLLRTTIEGEAVVLGELPPLPATVRFAARWSVPGVTERSAVFFFRLFSED